MPHLFRSLRLPLSGTRHKDKDKGHPGRVAFREGTHNLVQVSLGLSLSGEGKCTEGKQGDEEADTCLGYGYALGNGQDDRIEGYSILVLVGGLDGTAIGAGYSAKHPTVVLCEAPTGYAMS